MGRSAADDEKAIVDRWLADVSRAARGRDAALSALKDERKRLEEVERMPASYQGRLRETRARMAEAVLLLEEREREHADKVPEFVALMDELPDSLVARALVLRTLKGKTWQQCSMLLFINRTHLERLYRKSMPDLVKLVPDRYRG